MRFTGFILYTLLIILLALPRVVQAQETEPDTVGAVPLDPVVVTALRTPFVLTEAPYAIAVNDRAEIRRAKPGLRPWYYLR